MCFISFFITGSYTGVMTSMRLFRLRGIQSAEPMKTFSSPPRCKYKYTGMFQIAVDDTVYPDIFTYSLYACYQ